MKRPHIVYSLSKDRTTQKFNKTKFQDIIKDIDKFLQSCTTANTKEPDKVELTAYTAYDDTDPKQVLLDCRIRAIVSPLFRFLFSLLFRSKLSPFTGGSTCRN